MVKISGSSQEIERRWLLTSIPKEIRIKDLKIYTNIRQSYISKKPVIRIRSHDNSKFVLCIKTQGVNKNKNSLARPEQEIEINRKEYFSLLKRSLTETLIKKRYFFKYKKLLIELDVFGGSLKGLIFIEVEFETDEAAQKFIAPKWFGKEVTGIKKYSNSNLVKMKK